MMDSDSGRGAEAVEGAVLGDPYGVRAEPELIADRLQAQAAELLFGDYRLSAAPAAIPEGAHA